MKMVMENKLSWTEICAGFQELMNGLNIDKSFESVFIFETFIFLQKNW